MKFKEFVKWCNERAADGCWGMIESMTCIWVLGEVRKEPFWRREKVWKDKYEKDVLEQIVDPTEEKIAEFMKGEKK